MKSNVDLLKQNLKKWFNINNCESEDLKKKIIDAINYFKSFCDNELVLMLEELSNSYRIKDKERLAIYSNDSDSLKDQNYLVQIINEPKITFFAKDSINDYVRFNCQTCNFYLCIKGIDNYGPCPLLEAYSVNLSELSRTLDTKTLLQLREIYEPISEILELMKNQDLLDEMVNRCNEKIESLLN